MCFVAAAGLAGVGKAVGTVLSVVGTVVSAVGAYQQGKQAQATANYNAKVAENNALAEQQRAAYDSSLIREKGDRMRAAQEAGFAASGLDVGEGTPVAVLGDTVKQTETDVLARLYGGDSAATAYRNDATLYRAEGKAARRAGNLNAASSLIGGFGRLAGGLYGTGGGGYRPLSPNRY